MLPSHVRKPLADRYKNQTIVPPKTFRAAYRLQQKDREKIAFGKGAAPGTKAGFAATIVAMKFEVLLKPELVGGVTCHTAPRKNKTTQG
jgi:hypothetical protein